MTALIDSEYESTCAPGLAELYEYLKKGALAGAPTVSVLKCNVLVAIACRKLLADPADESSVRETEQDRSIQHCNG